MKIVYSDQKTGKSAQMQLDNEKSAMLMNHKINDVIDGGILGLEGYKLKITGGSDTSGFPMNRSITGAIKTKVLRKIAKSGKKKGQHRRSTVRGNTITADIELVNTVIVEYGSKPANELFPDNPERKKAKEEKKAQKK
jgi:small subunit ribosomal protein S6e